MTIRVFAGALVLLPAVFYAGTGEAQIPQAQMRDAGSCTPTPALHYSIQAKIKECSIEINAVGDYASSLPEHRAGGLYVRGLLHHLEGQYQLAVDDYTTAIGVWRNNEDAYAARGDAYEDMGQHEKAAADYTQAAVLKSDSPDQLAVRCWVRAVRGRSLDRALADCNVALDARADGGPFESNTLDSRCFVYYRMGNYRAAVADCARAESLRKRLDTSLYIGGLAKLRLGDTAGGNSDIAAALDADYRVADKYALYGVTR